MAPTRDGSKPPGGPAAPDAAANDQQRRVADGAACLAAALEYLRLGWSPLALCPSDHVGVRRVSQAHSDACKTPGKRPWHTWTEYQERRPAEAEVRRWWAQLPNSNVGVALGPVSGLVRVDVDGPAGEERLRQLAGEDLPPTLEFVGDPSKGGRGLLFRIPPGVVLRTTNQTPKKGEELRFQAKGAQTVLPPSRHPSGAKYAWKPGRGPGEIEAALMPTWLVMAMAPLVAAAAPQASPGGGRDLEVAAAAEPPTEKLRALLERSRAAKEAFGRKHEQPDASTSGQDWTLALTAARAGWTPQEIVNLLLYCRAQNGEDQSLGNPSYYRYTAAKAVAQAGGSAAASPPCDLTVGPFVLRSGSARRTPSGSVKVQLGVFRDGRLVFDFVLSPYSPGWRHHVAVLQSMAGDAAVDRDAMLAAFGRIIAEGALRADAPPAPPGPDDGPTVEAVVKDRAPARWQLTARTGKGAAWSEARGGEVGRGEFVACVDDELMAACSEAVDAPRASDGRIARPELLRLVQTELQIAWATIVRALPPLAEAETGTDTAAGKAFREAMVRLWTAATTWEIPRKLDGKADDQIGATRASLISRVRSQLRHREAGPEHRGREKWNQIHPAAAWSRVAVVDGEVLTVLGMRWEIVATMRQELPAVTDQESLLRLGRHCGVVEEAPPVPDRLSGGKGRLAVLTREFTAELMSAPDDAEAANHDGDEGYEEEAAGR